MAADLVCVGEGCDARVTSQGKSGLCRRCAARATMARFNADPEIKKKRAATFAAQSPEQKRAQAARLNNRVISPEEMERRRAHGRRLAATFLKDPDLIARRDSPEQRKKAGQTRTDRALGWCPPHLRPLYRHLCWSKHYTAAEAREIIEADIPGTVAYVRRHIENSQTAAQIIEEQRRAQES